MNAHEVWSRERMKEGWRYGPQRDDILKLHPCLVPYDQLQEGEKEYDRAMVGDTLKAVLARGYRIEPEDASPARGAIDPPVLEWALHLENEGSHEVLRGSPRRWEFDMDDAPEIAGLSAHGDGVAGKALKYLQEKLYPSWVKADETARKGQKRHRQVATIAIGAGILAILLAILQLVMVHISPVGKTVLGKIEILAIFAAAGAILAGSIWHSHHAWLCARQCAERLRVLKFQALSWSELWCDLPEWQKKVDQGVKELRDMTPEQALEWVKDDTIHPELVPPPACGASSDDVEIISALYRVKRLKYQQQYFQAKAGEKTASSRIADWKLGLWIFGVSFGVVMIHAFHLLPEGGNHEHLEICAIGLAALLPVAGFGLRAWLAAFETPRSKNLFRAKAHAVDIYIKRSLTSAGDLGRTMHNIAHGEHFFSNEHREWCRLQLEAEWFV